MLFLAVPSVVYRDDHLQALHELQVEGRYTFVDLKSVAEDFPGYIQSLLDEADRTKLKPGWVPGSRFWLIDGNEFIGELSLRHELNQQLFIVGGHIGYTIRPTKRRQGYGKAILRLGLEKARERGLQRVLVTCDEDNIGSKKIIEANGGQFENALEVEGARVRKLRYWIDIR